MEFELSGLGKDGKPTRVRTNDGFMQTARKFDEETDGWMLDQLDPNDFEIIRMGRQTQALVNEVNRLRRENFQLNRSIK